jgi:carboxymethylenebutenolidase
MRHCGGDLPSLASVTDSAYFVAPPSGSGPGVLLLHSWWGLTPFFRKLADRISDEGFTVLAPDLNQGSVFEVAELAEQHLADADPNHLARLVLSSAKLLQDRTGGGDEPVAVVGFSMGASLGLWASVRLPDVISAVVAFYGTQSIDFEGAEADYQLHFADRDPLVPDDEAAFMEATMGLAGLDVETHHYPGVRHWFFEADRENYDEQAAEEAWQRLVSFLGRRIHGV